MTVEIETRAFSLPLETPLDTARGTIDHREGILLRIEADGSVGLGEATPLPGWTESLETCRDALTEIADCDAFSGLADLDARLDALSEATAARHAVSLALADLRARRADEPLYRRLGGSERAERVPVNATVGDGDVAATVAAVEHAVDAGFECVKVKVGARSVAEDVRRLRAVREAVGPDVELRADANGAWSQAEAERAFESFADCDVAYVEQPLPADDLAGLADLRGGSVGVAADETLAENSVGAVLDADAADVLVCKPMALGGRDDDG